MDLTTPLLLECTGRAGAETAAAMGDEVTEECNPADASQDFLRAVIHSAGTMVQPMRHNKHFCFFEWAHLLKVSSPLWACAGVLVVHTVLDCQRRCSACRCSRDADSMLPCEPPGL